MSLTHHAPRTTQHELRFTFHVLRFAFLLALIILLALLLSACNTGPIVTDASIEPATISPNADGDTDVARIAYTIRRPSDVSIYFVDENGEKHYFRKDQHRGDRNYNVLWGGCHRWPGFARWRVYLGDRDHRRGRK